MDSNRLSWPRRGRAVDLAAQDRLSQWHRCDRPASPLLQASLDEFLSLRADDPLIDRLLEAVDVSLRHAQLHLIASVLSLDGL
jgi:hypothetical protein